MPDSVLTCGDDSKTTPFDELNTDWDWEEDESTWNDEWAHEDDEDLWEGDYLGDEEGSLDRADVTTVTVNVYYTSDAKKANSDMKGWVANKAAIANKNYKASGIPLVLKVLCVSELTNFAETSKMGDMLDHVARYNRQGGSNYNTVGNEWQEPNLRVWK